MYYLLLMGCGFLIAVAIGQLYVPQRTAQNNLLFLLVGVSFVWLTHGIGFKLGLLDFYPHLNKLHVPFLALTGPFWFLYVRVLLTREGWRKSDRKHLLPALLSTVLLIPFMLQSETYKREYVEINLNGIVSALVYIATRIAELACIVYLALAIAELQSDAAGARSKLPVQSNSIVLVLTGFAFVAAIARLLGSVAGNHTVSVLLPVVIILAAFIGFHCLSYRYPCLLALGIRATRTKRITLEGAEQLDLFRERIRTNRWHLDPNLKIKQLARRLGVPAHDLSGLINAQSGENYNHFINALRIEHAKEQLVKQVDSSIIDIALTSGFNSASAFYTQFTRFETIPPATYRRSALDICGR